MSSGGIEIPVTFEAGGSQVTLEKLAAQIQELERDTKGLAASTKQASTSFGTFAKSAAGLAAGILSIGAATKFVSDSIKAQSAQIAAVNKLNLALANQGELSKAASQDLQDYAAALQEVTVFGDETIIAVEGQLASFGLVGDELKRATEASLDFASATGSELRAAADLVGKAFVGETGSLSRYGIVLEDNLEKTEKFEAAVSQLEARFGGAARAATETFTGGLKQLSNSFGDTQEAFGKFIGFVTGEGGSAFAGLTRLVTGLTKFFGEDLILALSEVQAQFAEFVGATIDRIGDLAEIINRIPGVDIDTTGLRLAAEDQRTFAIATRAAGDAAATSVGVTADFTNAISAEGAAAAATAEELKELEKRQNAVAASVRSLTGDLDPAKFSILTDALEEIGDASLIAESQLKKLATKLIDAEKQGLPLPAIAEDIVSRFLEMEAAAASVEVLNTSLEEQARILALLGPGVEGIAEALLDVQSAVGLGGGLEIIDNAQLLEAIKGLDAVAVSAEEAGVEVEGLGESFLAALAEAAARGIDVSDIVTQFGDDTAVATEKGAAGFEALGETMQSVAALFDVLGIEAESFAGRLLGALSAIPAGLSSITDGLGSLFEGLGAEGGLLDSISGVLGDIGVAGQIAVAGIGIGKAIVGLFGSSPVEKAEKEAGELLGFGISEALAESIADSADTLGVSLADAVLLSLPAAIEESGQAAVEFTGEILELQNAIADGSVPAAEGIEALGGAFELVASEALEAGRVGDVALRTLIARSRELGQEVPEITAFVNAQLDQATTGLGRFVDSLAFVSEEAFATLGADAGVIFGATFDALVSERGLVGAVDALEGQFGTLRETLEENLGADAAAAITAPFAAAFNLLQDENLRPLVEGIDGLGQAFSALANADFLNIDQFRAAERASATLFDELIAGGADTRTSLTAIAPTIQAAISAAEQFGIPLSEDTQRLKDLAEQNGITFKTDPQQAMLDVLTAIAEVLGADIPASALAAQNAITGMQDQIQENSEIPGIDPFGPTAGVGGAGVPGAPGVPVLAGAPGAVAPGAAAAEAVQNIEFNLDLTIDENPLAAAETAEALRKQTIEQVADALEDRVASLVAAAESGT